MNQIYRSISRIIIFTFMLLSCISLSFADNVRIECCDSKGLITLIIEDASITEALAKLSQSYEFKIEGLEDAVGGETFTAQFKGNLESILQRLLRNQNHLIIRSSKKLSGIERIVILQKNQSDDDSDTGGTNTQGFTSRFTKNPEK